VVCFLPGNGDFQKLKKTNNGKTTLFNVYPAERMVLMYAHAAKTAGWFKEVTIIT
jgi:hypothetical protein